MATHIDVNNLSDTARTYSLKGCWLSPGNGSVIIDSHADFEYEVVSAHCETDSGSCDVKIEIDNGSGWTAVTGINGITATSSGVDGTATANNTVEAEGRLRLTVLNYVDAVKLAFSVTITEQVA